jgi:hypothetical protein
VGLYAMMPAKGDTTCKAFHVLHADYRGLYSRIMGVEDIKVGTGYHAEP